MTPQEIEALRIEALKDKVEALSGMVEILKAERDALAAWLNDACALFARIAQSEEAAINNDVKHIIDSELMYDISDFVEYKTPQQCLRDVQAKAAYSGYVAGWSFQRKPLEPAATQYAESVRQGGAQ